MVRGSTLCLVLGAFVFESGVFCQSYAGVNVGGPGIPGATALETYPTSIKKQGDIAGHYVDNVSGTLHHGFVLIPGRTEGGVPAPFASFDVLRNQGPFNGGTFATSINDAGAITGYFVMYVFPINPQTATNHGFVRDPQGNFTTFDPPGSISTIAKSINLGGAIAGYYNESNLVVHGFVREPNGTIIRFDPPGSISTGAVGINANGTITGSYADANNRSHGFLRRPGGEIVSFDPPESTGTQVIGINTAGTIAGVYGAPNGRTFGFVRQPGGTLESFEVPGSIAAINDEGTITGNYSDSSGSHGFVRSPGGMITSFDAPFCHTVGGVTSTTTTAVTNINQAGVIIGHCLTYGIPFFVDGFERFPAM